MQGMTAGGRSQTESLQALKSFQSSVMGKMGKTVSSFCATGCVAL